MLLPCWNEELSQLHGHIKASMPVEAIEVSKRALVFAASAPVEAVTAEWSLQLEREETSRSCTYLTALPLAKVTAALVEVFAKAVEASKEVFVPLTRDLVIKELGIRSVISRMAVATEGVWSGSHVGRVAAAKAA
jgi:hypothetical protein